MNPTENDTEEMAAAITELADAIRAFGVALVHAAEVHSKKHEPAKVTKTKKRAAKKKVNVKF